MKNKKINVEQGLYLVNFWSDDTEKFDLCLVYLLSDVQDDYILIWFGKKELSLKIDEKKRKASNCWNSK